MALSLPIKIHGSGPGHTHRTPSKLKSLHAFQSEFMALDATRQLQNLNVFYAFQSKYMVLGPSYHPQYTFKTQLSLTPSNQSTCFWGLATTYKTPTHIDFVYAFQSKYMALWPCPHPQDTFQTRFALRLPIKIRLAVKTTASLVFAMLWGLLCFGPHPKPTFSKRGMGP